MLAFNVGVLAVGVGVDVVVTVGVDVAFGFAASGERNGVETGCGEGDGVIMLPRRVARRSVSVGMK